MGNNTESESKHEQRESVRAQKHALSLSHWRSACAVYNMSSSGADSVSSMDSSANKNKNNNIRNINT